jgi:hypothetical protein
LNYRQAQAWLLRFIGALDLLAFAALFLPARWLDAAHHHLGLGDMSQGPVYDCLVRQMCFSCGMLGVALWFLATDVSRFRPLVMLTGVGYLVAGPVLVAIDRSAGLPSAWAWGNGGICFLIGASLLCLSAADRTRASTHESSPAAAPRADDRYARQTSAPRS